MPEPRTSQDLFNKVADIIDFTPEKYNQGVWGNAATKYVGIDPAYVEWDNITWEHDELDLSEGELKESDRVDDACGTQACVAGWACLLSNLHPTVITMDVENEPNRWGGSIVNRISGVLSDLFSKNLGYNYNVMCNNPEVECPDYRGHLLQMDDIQSDDGLALDGNIFYRPDYQARVLLGLNRDEACTLFDGDFTWEADDLRMIGKGENIDELLESKWGENRCDECEEYEQDCGC
jgi:hypothetical protein